MGEIVLDRADLVRRCEAHRAEGRRVVLTNGTFDLLHVGHVRALQDARSRGDVLVVAINDDESVRRYKGEDRPFVPGTERAELVAAIGCVDLVHLFGEPNVESLLRALRPHVHAKGRDYTAGNVPERAVALEVGAEIAIVGDPKDHSVTDLVSRVRASK